MDNKVIPAKDRRALICVLKCDRVRRDSDSSNCTNGYPILTSGTGDGSDRPTVLRLTSTEVVFVVKRETSGESLPTTIKSSRLTLTMVMPTSPSSLICWVM